VVLAHISSTLDLNPYLKENHGKIKGDRGNHFKKNFFSNLINHLIIMENTKQILIIHGGTTYQDYAQYLDNLKKKVPKLEWIQYRKDWKNELQEQLGNKYAVYLPTMPNKTNAQYNEWKILFERIVNLLDNNFILIGHSLGAIFIVKYLSENKILKTPKKILLLGTPYDNESMEEEPLYSFLREKNLKNLKKLSEKLYFYQSKDDFIVPFENIKRYQEALPGAYFRKLKNYNHFLVEKIPELLIDIEN